MKHTKSTFLKHVEEVDCTKDYKYPFNNKSEFTKFIHDLPKLENSDEFTIPDDSIYIFKICPRCNSHISIQGNCSQCGHNEDKPVKIIFETSPCPVDSNIRCKYSDIVIDEGSIVIKCSCGDRSSYKYCILNKEGI